MKSRSSTCIRVMPLLVALAVPIQFAAQDNQGQDPKHEHNHHQHYTFTELGTLGGVYSEAVGIDRSGSMAGTSTPSDNSIVHAVLWEHGVITDLGPLGGPNSDATEAAPQPNESGEVAGVSDTTTLDPNAAAFCNVFTFISDPYTCRPFVWRHGIMTELPTLGGNNGVAWQVNNRGQVTGIAENTTPDPELHSRGT
jgi:probable HAF family extracellular repeat protein